MIIRNYYIIKVFAIENFCVTMVRKRPSKQSNLLYAPVYKGMQKQMHKLSGN